MEDLPAHFLSSLILRRDSVMYHLSLYTPEKIENLFAFAYKLEAEAEAFVPTENRNVCFGFTPRSLAYDPSFL